MENDPPMTPRSSLLVRFAVSAALLAAPGMADAGEVKCPVCGEVFDDAQGECPNDGTDLRLVGVRIEKPGDAPDTAETAPGEEPVEGEGEPAGGPRYTRHDQGGDRQAVSQEEAPTYTDRRSRIHEERRGGTTAAERTKQEDRAARQRAFEEEDRRLLAEIAVRRGRIASWRESGRLAAVEGEKGRLAAETRLLYSLAAPLTSFGVRMLWMGEGRSAGPVSSAEIDINLARYRLRAGFSTLLGIRSVTGRNDILFLESVAVGFQWPWRFSPFLLARGGIGVLVSERFGHDIVDLVTSLGAEVGIDCWATPWFAITPSVGYARVTASDAYWNTFTAKLSVGF